MPLRISTSLWWRLALAFSLFVATGALLLVAWLDAAAQRSSRESFASLARTNAELIRNARLPTTERTAEYLGRVLNLRVFFRRDATGEFTPQPTPELPVVTGLNPEEGIVRIDAVHEAIAVPVDRGVSLLLVRPAEPRWAFLRRGEMLPLLGTFGLLSIALAWALAGGIVRPLRQLARRLPQIEHDPEASLPGAERSDEIGQLARAYLATRTQLAEERARREQAEKLALLGRMATGLAHEIHNPLAAIRMHAQLLESSSARDLEQTAAESLPVLIGETARIEGLVQQWMFLARPEPPQTSRADLRLILHKVLRTLAPQARHAGVDLVHGADQEVWVQVDTRRIEQVIGNIALNAIQAMPGGGRLVVSTHHESPSRCVQVVFSDTGRGFSAAATRTIRRALFSEKEGGMGIGLSVAAEIMKAHGGTLEIANASTGGAVVTLTLPADPQISGA